MGDTEHHRELAVQKKQGALDELKKGRASNVGDLTLKAVEQAIEAAAAQEGKHFHLVPKTAHGKRFEWLKTRLPQLVEEMDELWGTYGDLGYGGINGERAQSAVESMEKILDGIGGITEIQFE
ncbi:MAG: hypothetical protein ACE5KH_02325 [Candidatus Geothermarchaeales archaeon]